MAIRHLHGCQYGSSPANHLHRESLIHYVEGGGVGGCSAPHENRDLCDLSSEAGGEMGYSEII